MALSKGISKEDAGGDFAGGPVVRSPSFHCGGQGFHPWVGK